MSSTTSSTPVGTLSKVVWHDAADQAATWSDAAEIEKFGDELVEITSVGWVVRLTKQYLTLAGDKANDGTFGRVCKIPMGMVVSVESLSDGPAVP